MTTIIDIPALKAALRRQNLNGCGEPLMRHCKHHEEGACCKCQPAMFSCRGLGLNCGRYGQE